MSSAKQGLEFFVSPLLFQAGAAGQAGAEAVAGKPSEAPAPPAAAPTAPSVDTSSVSAAADYERERSANRGRASTILTSLGSGGDSSGSGRKFLGSAF